MNRTTTASGEEREKFLFDLAAKMLKDGADSDKFVIDNEGMKTALANLGTAASLLITMMTISSPNKETSDYIIEQAEKIMGHVFAKLRSEGEGQRDAYAAFLEAKKKRDGLH